MKKVQVLCTLCVVLFCTALISSNVYFCLKNTKQAELLQKNDQTIEEYEKQLNDNRESISSLQQQLKEAEQREAAVPASAAIPKITTDYQNLYPEMSSDFSGFSKKSGKIAYFTFDDGPSDNTDKILSILTKYNIKATFFVACKDNANNKQKLKEIVKQGHTIGIHTYSHAYKSIYASVKNYLYDFHREYTLVYKATGVKPSIFRFPGGSINTYNVALYQQLIGEMLRRNFIYYDWNVSSGDAAGKITSAEIAQEVLSQSSGKSKAIILFHDSSDKTATVEALPGIIEKLQSQGFTFQALDNTVSPINFGYKG